MAEPGRIDPQRDALLRLLQEADVAFVLVGGVAIESHGVRHRTDDVDVTPQGTPENLERLASALNGLDCKLVIDPSDSDQDIPLPVGYFTAANLARQDVWNLRTTYGNLDIPFRPGGFPRGYEDLDRGAQSLLVAETSVTVRIAALKDIEHSKRTVARQKDVDYLNRVGRLQAPVAPAS